MALTAVMVTAVALDLSAPNLLDASELGGNRSVRSVPCHIDEYPYQGKCCRNCPAGTHVSQHCRDSHERGSCVPCISGVSFTAFPNGLEACLSCSPCRANDQEQVEACSATSNTKCQCRWGTYCTPNETCDLYCSTCTSCPEGQREKHPCNATSDVLCEMKSRSDSTIMLSVLLPMLLLVVLAVIAVIWWKKRLNGGDRTDVMESVPFSEEEKGHVIACQTAHNDCCENQVEYEAGVGELNMAVCAGQPAHAFEGGSNARSVDGCNEELDDSRWFQCYSSLKDNIPPCRWKELMRGLGLGDIDIEHVMMSAENSREQNYQMFLLWRIQKGREASMCAVFRVLDEIKLKGCREQTASDLQSKGINIQY